MKLTEALAWLRGERSVTNMVNRGLDDSWRVVEAQTDAAMIQQAYWVVRANREGLLPEEDDDV